MAHKSAAALAVVPVEGATTSRHLEPPRDASHEEKALFREVVASLPRDHLQPCDSPLLLTYCQATLLARSSFAAIDDGDKSMLRVWTAAVQQQLAAARSLRLAPHSREHPRTTMRRMFGRSYQSATGATLETIEMVSNGKMLGRPWIPRG